MNGAIGDPGCFGAPEEVMPCTEQPLCPSRSRAIEYDVFFKLTHFRVKNSVGFAYNFIIIHFCLVYTTYFVTINCSLPRKANMKDQLVL